MRSLAPFRLPATGVLLALSVAAAPALPGRAAEPAVADSGVAVPFAAPDPVAEIEASLAALAPLVRGASHAEALRHVVTAYHNFRGANPERVGKPYLWFVDLGLANGEPRGWVFDMSDHSLVEGPFHVAHGRGSLKARNGVPTRFSNASGSNASSLGVYVAAEIYRFSGKSGGRAYTSTGLRLDGASGPFNGAARRRGIVAHGAPYVTATDAGRSEGCPAIEPARAARLLPMIADGGIVVVYSPNDAAWLREDPWLRGAAGS